MNFYLGTQGRLESVQVPTSGLERTRTKYRSGGILTNGGGWSRASASGHNMYNMNWDFIRNDAYAQINEILERDDLIHFLDPQAAVSNSLPSYIAQSGEAALGGYRMIGYSSTSTVAETEVLKPGITDGPQRTVAYEGIGDALRKEIWLPIPEGHTMHARGLTTSATGTRVLFGTTELPSDIGVVAVNRVNNPSFETDGEWLGSGNSSPSVWSTTATGIISGTHCMNIKTTDAPTSGTTGIGQEVGIVTPGQWVAARIPVRPGGPVPAARVSIGISWRDTNGVGLGLTRSALFSPAAFNYTTYAFSAQVPLNADRAQVYLYISSAASTVPDPNAEAATDTWIATVANTQAEAEADAATYFDGNTTDTASFGYSWAYIANNSRSYKTDLSIPDSTVPSVSIPSPPARGVFLKINAGDDISIRWLQAKVLPTGQAVDWSAGWQPGMGHSGCRLEGDPSYTLYSAPQAIDFGALSITLRETGAWE